LLLKELRNGFNPDLGTILSSFPDSLFGVYSRFLKQIEHYTAKFYVSAVLRWVAFSSRPINIFDLEDSLAFNFSNLEEFVYDPTRRGKNADRVCEMLEGLVVKEEQNYSKRGTGVVVSLAHASVKDYLLSEKIAHEYSV
jgi:hypothetical protein